MDVVDRIRGVSPVEGTILDFAILVSLSGTDTTTSGCSFVVLDFVGADLQFQVRGNPIRLDWGDVGSNHFNVGILVGKVARRRSKYVQWMGH